MKFRSSAAVAAAAAIALTLSACAPSAPPQDDAESAADQVLTIGMQYDITDWDPAMAHVGAYLQPYQVAYDTLILREPDGELSPMLATEWEYDDAHTVLTLSLRDDVTFSDGEAFDAEAVVANFEHFKSTNGRQAAQLSNYESSRAVDELTVEVTLSQPDPAFTYFLSQAAGLMGSPAALDGDDIGLAPVGSGPYVLDPADTVANSRYVFTPREDYWNPDLQKFGEVTLTVLADETARVNALLTGQVNAGLVSASSVSQVEAADLTLNAYEVDWLGMMLLDRDGTIEPALGDVRVRQAINYALDRKTLLQSLQFGYGTTTSQPFGEKSGAFDEDLEDAYSYDPERARDLLAEAGYADGFTLRIASMPVYETMFAALRQQFADVGISLEPIAVPAQDYVTEVTSGKYPVAFYGLFQGEAWVSINQMVAPNALYNVFKTSTPESEELINGVQMATDEESGDAFAVDLNRYVVENAWFAPLYRTQQLYITDETVTVTPQTQMAVPSIYNFAPAE